MARKKKPMPKKGKAPMKKGGGSPEKKEMARQELADAMQKFGRR